MVRLGINLWGQSSDWSSFLEAGRLVDRLGFDHLWTWDHLLPIFGPVEQPTFEPYTALTALAQATERVELGLFIGANTLRDPGMTAKIVTTIDHVSGGRAILGIGAGWNAREHRAFGIRLGRSPGERLDWLEESVAAMRRLFDGEVVTSPDGGRYGLQELRLSPLPVRRPLPIMVGGVGERKTLRTVARWADQWNAHGSPDELRHRDEVLRRPRSAGGRDPDEIERTVGLRPMLRRNQRDVRPALERVLAHNAMKAERAADFWAGTPEWLAERLLERRAVGFHTFIAEMPAPYDRETIELLASEVRPRVSAGA